MNTDEYMRKFMEQWNRYRSTIPEMMGGLKRSTAATYGTAARKRASAYSGSMTSGAYGRGFGDIYAQRAGELAGIESQLREQENQQILSILPMAIAAEARDKERRAQGLAGIGKAVGTAGGAIVGGIAGGPAGAVAGANIGNQVMGGGGGIPQMPMGGNVMPQKLPAGLDMNAIGALMESMPGASLDEVIRIYNMLNQKGIPYEPGIAG